MSAQKQSSRGVKKMLLKNSQNSQEKTYARISSFSKAAGLGLTILLKEKLWHGCFPVNFAKYLRTPIFAEHLWRLFLSAKSLINTRAAI